MEARTRFDSLLELQLSEDEDFDVIAGRNASGVSRLVDHERVFAEYMPCSKRRQMLRSGVAPAPNGDLAAADQEKLLAAIALPEMISSRNGRFRTHVSPEMTSDSWFHARYQCWITGVIAIGVRSPVLPGAGSPPPPAPVGDPAASEPPIQSSRRRAGRQVS